MLHSGAQWCTAAHGAQWRSLEYIDGGVQWCTVAYRAEGDVRCCTVMNSEDI